MKELFSPKVQEALTAANATMEWAVKAVNGKTIPPADDDKDHKRVRLSAALWHLGLEHSMAIVLLVEHGMFGSALALVRIASEAGVRALWLSRVAKNRSVDNAAEDKFPPFKSMVDALEAPDALGPDALAAVKGATWGRLNDYTHSGAQQMLARLPKGGGIGDDYMDDEKLSAVGAADVLMHMCVIHMLGMTADAKMHDEAVQRLMAKKEA